MNYKVNTDEILITQLGEEGVAFNSSNNEYFSLNETSFKILKAIENNLSAEQTCELLTKEYDIAKGDCEKEINRTIQTFIQKKLIIEK